MAERVGVRVRVIVAVSSNRSEFADRELDVDSDPDTDPDTDSDTDPTRHPPPLAPTLRLSSFFFRGEAALLLLCFCVFAKAQKRKT